jgi:hypothetical protein
MKLSGSSFRQTGTAGVLRWGHHLAARVEAWSINNGWFRAAIAEPDLFALTQRPLVFVVAGRDSAQQEALEAWATRIGRPAPSREFRRELLDVRVQGSILTGRIGPRR